jgi:hypothetical protein
MSFTALQFVQNGKNNNSYTGVFRYIKTSGVKSTKEGELYGFLEISSDGEFPAERVAHMAWDGVVEGYMYSQTKSISESLKSGIQEFTRRLKDLMRNSKELEVAGIDVNLVIVAATKEGIYVAKLGDSDIFAYRGEKIVDVIEILEKNGAQTAGFMTSEDDLVVISTHTLLSENMHTLIGKNNREEILKSLNLLGKTLLPEQGIFCIYLEKAEKEGQTRIIQPFIKEKTQGEKKDIEGKPKHKEEKNDERGESQLFKEVKEKKGDKIDLKEILVKAKLVFSKIYISLQKIFKAISDFFSKIFMRIGVFLKDKFGNKRWFKKYAARASQMRSKKKSPDIRIDGYKTSNLRAKRIKIVILATLAVVIAVGGYQYARKQKEIKELHTQTEQIYTEIEGRLNKAQSALSTDREQSEIEIFAANNLLDEVPEGISEEYINRKKELEKEILGVEDDLYKRVIVSPEAFVGFFDEGSELTDMEYVIDNAGNEMLIVADRGTSSVWEVSIYDKKKNRMGDNDGLIDSPEFVDIGNEGDVFIYDSSVGVLKATASSSGWGAFEKLTGVGLTNIKVDEVGEFAVLTATDNLYYLDLEKSKIVKSVNYGTGYSSTVVDVISDERFVNANDFFADFSIYILTSGNEGVVRYSAGAYVPIAIVGVNGELGELTCGDTSGNMDFAFYMFDRGSRRILRMEKPRDSYNDKLHPNELVLLNQYIYRGEKDNMWSDVKEVVVDKAEKNMYILDGNQVWQVSL